MSNLTFKSIINIFNFRISLFKLNPDTRFFTVFFILKSDNLCVFYFFECQNKIFNFFRIYIFSTPYDKILDSSHNCNITLVVQASQISRPQPSWAIDCAWCGLYLIINLVVIPILSHHIIASTAELTSDPPGYGFTCLGVYNLNLNMRWRPSYRLYFFFIRIVKFRLAVDRTCLSLSVSNTQILNIQFIFCTYN